jgi:hypothetical protein
LGYLSIDTNFLSNPIMPSNKSETLPRNCQQKSKSIGEIVQGLVLIWQVLEVDEMMNHLEYL